MSAVRIHRGGGCITARSQRATWRRRLSRPLRMRPKRLRLLAVPALRSNYQAQGGQTAGRLRARAYASRSTFLLVPARIWFAAAPGPALYRPPATVDVGTCAHGDPSPSAPAASALVLAQYG